MLPRTKNVLKVGHTYFLLGQKRIEDLWHYVMRVQSPLVCTYDWVCADEVRKKVAVLNNSGREQDISKTGMKYVIHLSF